MHAHAHVHVHVNKKTCPPMYSTESAVNCRIFTPTRHPAGHLHPIIRVPASLVLPLQSNIKFNIPLGNIQLIQTWTSHMTQHTICNVNIQWIKMD